MSTVVHELTEEEKKQFQEQLEANKIVNAMPKEMQERFKSLGWTFNEWSMEKKHNGIYLVIEFCIGDICTYPCSKKEKWMLAERIHSNNFFQALVEIVHLEEFIDNGNHWQGEED